MKPEHTAQADLPKMAVLKCRQQKRPGSIIQNTDQNPQAVACKCNHIIIYIISS